MKLPAALAAVTALLLTTTVLPVAAAPNAGVGLSINPLFPEPVTVGATNLPGSLGFSNSPTTFGVGPVTTSDIRLFPSCKDAAAACNQPDPGVIALTSPGIGEPGSLCAGVTFIISLVDPATGEYSFTPPTPIVLPPPGTPGPVSCIIDFTFSVLKAPTADANPGQTGLQTRQFATINGTAIKLATGATIFGSGAGTSITSVLRATPSIPTTATPTAVPGATIGDTATVTGVATGGPIPTGTVAFAAFGPDDAQCTGPAVPGSTASVALSGGALGPPPTASAATTGFVPTAAGTYRWVATYSGDANYVGVTSACNALNEASVVSKLTPGLTTNAAAAPPGGAALGQPISDTATLTAPAGVLQPTGTVVFTLFGPGDATCAGTAVFTSAAVPVSGAGTYASGPFTPPTAGTYLWRAAYSGDANFNAVTTPCGDANETSLLNRTTPTLTTILIATAPANLGTPIHDTATIGGLVAPTTPGTITFNFYGPGNTTCSGTPIFVSVVPVNTGNGVYQSQDFTPTATGTYQVVAVYSGNVNNGPVTTSCNDANESVVITRPVAGLTTNATAIAPLGQPISDTATLTAPPAPTVQPTGTITFTLFGPNDATCSTAAVFTSAAVPVTGAGTYPSGPFTPPGAGTYRWRAAYSGDAAFAAITTPCNDANESTVVNQGTPTITTNATPSVPLGQPISDTATLTTPPAPAAQPTGTITFTLFGPDDATCSTAAAFTSAAVPVTGSGTYPSGPFTPTGAGSYRWRAAYSGDANYAAVSTPCNDANETSVVGRTTPTLTTILTPMAPATLGNPIHDSATIGGLVGTALGTITFHFFGPGNTTCGGTPIFVSVVPVNTGNGVYQSQDFTPTATGTYQVVAAYSGNVNNGPVTTSCNDANESVVITRPVAGLTTNATAIAPLGQPISDTATLTAPPAPTVQPTGTITFTLFGPNDATCSTAAVFTSAAVPVTGAGTYPSGPFTPPGAGTYRWRAAYSGDAAFAAITTPCNDANESTVVNQGTPTITTNATASAPIGQAINDTATLTTPAAPAAAGTITFTLFGPDDATCSTTAVFTSAAVPVTGAGIYPSGPFTPTSAGTYRWRAAYSGDANYAPVSTPCNDANETSVLNQATPTLTTILTTMTPVTLGTPIHDTATLGGLVSPTTPGTITFNFYGPNNTTCSGTPIFVSVVQVNAGNGVYPSESFTPTAPGAYQVIALYSGNVNNAPVTTSCNDANESVVITLPTPAIMVVKTATPSSRVEPGGSFTFNVVVTNTGPEAVTLKTLTDDKYGDISTKGTCTTAVGTVLVADPDAGGPLVGGSYSCSFVGSFTGVAGNSQTDVVTVGGVGNVSKMPVTATANAKVTLTPMPASPVIPVQVNQVPAAPAPVRAAAAALPRTGSESASLATLAAALMGLGGLLVLWAKLGGSWLMVPAGPAGANRRGRQRR